MQLDRSMLGVYHIIEAVTIKVLAEIASILLNIRRPRERKRTSLKMVVEESLALLGFLTPSNLKIEEKNEY